MNELFAIAIHGGAGTIEKQRMADDVRAAYENALREALETGRTILQQGGSSMDAVEAAVISLEDCHFFNAGRGSVFTSKGTHEMDAAIMNGETLAAGAVAGVTGVKNPIKLARIVMEKTKHVFVSGEGAVDLAKLYNLPMEAEDYFFTDYRYNDWKNKQQHTSASASQKHLGTVGAVALDQAGNLAAATSTGGITNKSYGRIGDSPVIGAGTYANNYTCAISCTGDGEQFIRAVIAYDVSCCMEYKNASLHDACANAMQKLQDIQGTGGLIAIDSKGNIEMPFNTEGMYRACYYPDGGIVVKIFE
jgi:beta-aspartyl-peptidase (threonine type)